MAGTLNEGLVYGQPRSSGTHTLAPHHTATLPSFPPTGMTSAGGKGSFPLQPPYPLFAYGTAGPCPYHCTFSRQAQRQLAQEQLCSSVTLRIGADSHVQAKQYKPVCLHQQWLWWRQKFESKNHRLQKAVWIQLLEEMCYCAFRNPVTMRNSPVWNQGAKGRRESDGDLGCLLDNPPFKINTSAKIWKDTEQLKRDWKSVKATQGVGVPGDAATTQGIRRALPWKRKLCG